MLVYRAMNTSNRFVTGCVALGLLAATVCATGCETRERVVVRGPPPPQRVVVVQPAPVVQERVVVTQPVVQERVIVRP